MYNDILKVDRRKVMNERLIRTQMVIGEDGVNKLQNSHVAIFGIGGVGSFTAEALARAGVGELTFIDFDTVAKSNINRQIHAMVDTVGGLKVEIMKERVLRINPDLIVHCIPEVFTDENSEEILSAGFDYVVDAIDLVRWKLHLIESCYKKDIKIISSMGTGNKMDPTRFKVDDIYKTTMCPLAKVLRKELKARGVKTLQCVYSDEPPVTPEPLDVNTENPRKQTPGSMSFVPSVSGLIMASQVVTNLLK
jgi:tRNA A37 threonylcarbamoyladenosine dehydratase